MPKVSSDPTNPLKGRVLNQRIGGRASRPFLEGKPSPKRSNVPGRVSLGSNPKGRKMFRGV